MRGPGGDGGGPAPGPVPGAVLAGGESRRFGASKALAPVAGEPMVLRAVRLLRTVSDPIWVLTARPEVARLVPDRVLPDRIPGMGPLGGIHAALREAAHGGFPGVLVLGCDMPLVPPSLLARIRAEARDHPHRAVVPLSGPDRMEPLCAWYPVALLPEVERRLEASGPDRSLQGLLTAADPRILPPGELWDPRLLSSANTPGELEALRRLLPGPGRGAPPSVAVVGWKDSGKTGVSVGLVAELRRRGLRVGAVKHGHGFRLDTPGTDSWRLREEGGGDPVLLTGPSGFVLQGDWGPEGELPVEALLSSHFSGVDCVVVEGFKGSSLPRIEVYRRALHPEPIHGGGEGTDGRGPGGRLLTVVTDAPSWVASRMGAVPVVELDDPHRSQRLADRVTETLLTRPLASGPRGPLPAGTVPPPTAPPSGNAP